MLGSRADANAMVVIQKYIQTPDDYYNDVNITNIFTEWQTLNLGPQIALDQDACDYFITNRLEWQ